MFKFFFTNVSKDGLHINEKPVRFSISQWLPCPLTILCFALDGNHFKYILFEVALQIYCHSLFYTLFNNLYSIHNCLLCKNPGNVSPLVTTNEKFNI